MDELTLLKFKMEMIEYGKELSRLADNYPLDSITHAYRKGMVDAVIEVYSLLDRYQYGVNEEKGTRHENNEDI